MMMMRLLERLMRAVGSREKTKRLRWRGGSGGRRMVALRCCVVCLWEW